MNRHDRNLFDRILQEELAALPEPLQRKLDEIPVIVEDEAPEEVLDDQGVPEDEDLCGLYTGVPLIERTGSDLPALPDTITLYRTAIFDEVRDDAGRVDTQALRREIRLTLLHEFGHHFGLGEKELDELGYG